MFVGTGAGTGALVVCPSVGEIVRDDDVPAVAAVEAPVVVPVGGVAVEGKRPQSEGEGAGAACSISIGSSAESTGAAAVDALGAAMAEDADGGGTAETTGAADAAGATGEATSPSCTRMTNTPTAPTNKTRSAVIPATTPLDTRRRELFTGPEIGAAALMLALTADVGA
jgi:hypothetical protein